MSGNGTNQTQRDPLGRFTSEAAQRRMASAMEIIANATYSRAQLVKKFFDPRRDIDDECGYPSELPIPVQYYREMYDREPVATRVVQVLPQESWKVQPAVYEDEDADAVTPFEQAWDELGRTLQGTSWYKSEESSLIWEYLARADELSGIGSYGAILLGIDDSKELSEPAEGIDEKGNRVGAVAGRRLLYLRCFDESEASIVDFQIDQSNPRYGQPTAYNISLGNPSTASSASTTGQANAKRVHWTRVIHIADNLGSSEVYGIPRMQPVYNRLYDLRKLYSGSAEMYWQGAFPGFSIETAPDMAGAKINAAAIRTQIEQHITGLQRWIAPDVGMTIKSLAPQVVDPTPQIDAQIQAICIQIGIPKRILMGSERGELSSSEDKGDWIGKLKARQERYLTPRLIVPFVNRSIALGLLPEPKEYHIAWPAMETLSNQDQAEIAAKRTEALAKYVQGGVDTLIPPMDYLTRVLGMTDEEAEAILEAATESVDDSLEGGDASTAVGTTGESEGAMDVESAGKLTKAITDYVTGRGDELIPPFEYMTLILGLPEGTAKKIVAALEAE